MRIRVLLVLPIVLAIVFLHVLSEQLFATSVVHGAGQDSYGRYSVEFGQVPDGAMEVRHLTLCDDSVVDVISVNDNHPLFSAELPPMAERSECYRLTVYFMADSGGCSVRLARGQLQLNRGSLETEIHLEGVSVSRELWQKQEHWRYSGSFRSHHQPFIISATQGSLIWLGGEPESNAALPDRATSLDIYRISGHRLVEQVQQYFSKDYFKLILPTLEEDPGIIPVNHITARDGLFAGVQPNGYVLVYNASNYQPEHVDILEPDFWSSRGFGGSPRFCSGPCIHGPAAYYEENILPPHCQEYFKDFTCSKDYPSKGEGIAISASGNCLILTNTFYHEVDTMSFNFTDPSRLNRSYNNKLGGIDLAKKRPELVVADNSNRIIIINREHSSAIVCSVVEKTDAPETSEESICALTQCHDFCEPVLNSATSAGYLPDQGLVVANTAIQRVYLISEEGDVLGQYPDQPETEPMCGLVKAVTHPHLSLVALLYNNPATVVIIQWQEEGFIELARFNAESVPDMDNPVDAVFNHQDGQDTLFIAMAGSYKIMTFQALPNATKSGDDGLPEGLTPTHLNETIAANNAVCYEESAFNDSMCRFDTGDRTVPCQPGAAQINLGLVVGVPVSISVVLAAGVGVAIVGYLVKKRKTPAVAKDMEMK